jgi:hypothetical protein
MPNYSQRKRKATQPFDNSQNPPKRARKARKGAAKGAAKTRRKARSASTGNTPPHAPAIVNSPPPAEENTRSFFVSDPVDLPEGPEPPPSAQPLLSIILSSGGVASDPIGSPTPQSVTQHEEPKSNTGQPEVEPYITCRWQAFIGPKKELYKPKFDPEFDVDSYYAAQLWMWVDDVVQDLSLETTPPQKVTIRDVSGCAYKQPTPERQKLRQSLKRGQGGPFVQVLEYAKNLRESHPDVVIDWDATLTTEAVEVISPMGQQRSRGSSSSQSAIRLTATQRQLQELPEVLAGHAVTEGPAIAIRDQWRCMDTSCANHPFACWIQRTPGQPDRFENHFPINNGIISMWSRNIALRRCTVEEPDDSIRLALRTSRELAAKEREKSKSKAQQSSTPAFNADSFMSAIAASALSVSQLAHTQLLGRQPLPTEPTASSVDAAPPYWRDLTYANIWELSHQTRHFFDWWMDNAMAKEVPAIKRVFREVVKGGDIDLNMLMDASDAGMPYSVWREEFGLPVPLLLRLRRRAYEWQTGYPGLSEDDREVCRDMLRADNERKELLRMSRERELSSGV